MKEKSLKKIGLFVIILVIGLLCYLSFTDINSYKISKIENDYLMVTEGDESCVVEGVEVKRMNKGADAVLDLMNGGVDAVVIDANPAEQFVLANDGKIKIVTDEAVNEEYAIAIPKGETELKDAVNKALAEMKADGTMDKLAEQYDAN